MRNRRMKNLKEQNNVEQEKTDLIKKSGELSNLKTEVNQRMKIALAKQKKLQAEYKLSLKEAREAAKLQEAKDKEKLLKGAQEIRNKQQETKIISSKIKDNKRAFSIEQKNKELTLKQELEKEKQETMAKLNQQKLEMKLKRQAERQKAIDLKNQIKEEMIEYSKKLLEERVKNQKELAAKKLELKLAKEKQSHQRRILKQNILEAKNKEILDTKDELLKLKEEKMRIKAEGSNARIKSRIRDVEIKSDLSQQQAEIEIQKEQSLNEKEARIQALRDEKVFVDGTNRVIDGSVVPVNNNAKLDDTSTHNLIFSEAEREEIDTQVRIQRAREDIIRLTAKYNQFERRGVRMLEIINPLITDNERRKYDRKDYFKTLIDNYVSLEKENALIDLKQIIESSYILSGLDFDDETIKLKYETIVKLVLQKINLNIGKLYIISTKIQGQNTYVMRNGVSSSDVSFNVEDLFNSVIIENMEKLINYKLERGGAIMICHGLAIENSGGDIQIALDANLLRL